MKYLKSDRKITGLIPAIVLYLILALSSALFGIETGLDITAVVVFCYAIGIFLGYRRTTNPYMLVSFAYLLLGSLWLYVFEPHMLKHYGGQLSSTALFLMILVVFLAFWLLYLLFTKRLKWKGREIMELIARDVDESDDGYTDRPRPCGRISASRLDIDEYVKYLRKNLIFLVVNELDRYILIPVKMGDEFRYLLKVNYEKSTWISLDRSGELTVHISKEDYLDYKVNLSYDQLSENLGTLVKHFYEEFEADNKVRILDEINSVNVGFFS